MKTNCDIKTSLYDSQRISQKNVTSDNNETNSSNEFDSSKIKMKSLDTFIQKENTPILYPIRNTNVINSNNMVKTFNNFENLRKFKILDNEKDRLNNLQSLTNFTITNNSIKKFKLSTIHCDHSGGNFSVNLENDINNNLESNVEISEFCQDEESKKLLQSRIKKNQKDPEYIIIFKLEEDYYVPMQLISENKESGKLKLQKIVLNV